MAYDKLVRWGIPEKIWLNGEFPVVTFVTGKELVTRLLEKLVEEANELAVAVSLVTEKTPEELERIVHESADVSQATQTIKRVCELRLDDAPQGPILNGNVIDEANAALRYQTEPETLRHALNTIDGIVLSLLSAKDISSDVVEAKRLERLDRVGDFESDGRGVILLAVRRKMPQVVMSGLLKRAI